MLLVGRIISIDKRYSLMVFDSLGGEGEHCEAITTCFASAKRFLGKVISGVDQFYRCLTDPSVGIARIY